LKKYFTSTVSYDLVLPYLNECAIIQDERGKANGLRQHDEFSKFPVVDVSDNREADKEKTFLEKTQET